MVEQQPGPGGPGPADWPQELGSTVPPTAPPTGPPPLPGAAFGPPDGSLPATAPSGPSAGPPGRRALVVGLVMVLLLGVVAGAVLVLRKPSARQGTGLTASAENIGVLQAPPLVGKHLVVLFTEAGILGVDARSREIMWKSETCVGAPADPVLRTFDHRVIARCAGDRLVSVDPGDGTEQWSVVLDPSPDRIRVTDSTIGISSPGQLSVRDAKTGTERWNRPIEDDILPLAIDAKYVYSGEGNNVLALDQRTGDEVWSSRETAGFLYADPQVVIDRTYGDQLSSINRQSGDLAWSTQFPGGSDKGLLYHSKIIGVTTGRIVVKNDENALAAFDADGGLRAWTLAEGSGDVLDVAVGDGRLAVVTPDRLRILDAIDGTVLDDRVTTAWMASIGSGRIAYVDDSGLVVQDLPAVPDHHDEALPPSTRWAKDGSNLPDKPEFEQTAAAMADKLVDPPGARETRHDKVPWADLVYQYDVPSQLVSELDYDGGFKRTWSSSTAFYSDASILELANDGDAQRLVDSLNSTRPKADEAPVAGGVIGDFVEDGEYRGSYVRAVKGRYVLLVTSNGQDVRAAVQAYAQQLYDSL